MKAKLLVAIPFLALSALTSQMAQAAPIDSTLTLSGQILPVACTMDHATNGIYDYGDIPATLLAATGKTALGEMSLDYLIQCQGATRIALKTIDNRSTSVNNPGGATVNDFGLDMDPQGGNIGYNTYMVRDPIIDGNAGRFLVSRDQGVSWTVDSGPKLENQPTSWISFTDAAGTAPVAVQTVTGPLVVEAFIGDKSGLDLSRPFDMNGFATMELLYL